MRKSNNQRQLSVLGRRGLLGAVLASMVVAACDMPAIGPAGGGRVDATRPVTVALMVPGGTGDENRQLLARNLENAARMAMADLQGVEIDLRVYQTGGDAARAAQLAAQAVSEGAKIILGPVFAAEATAVGQTVAPAGVNVLSFSNNPNAASSNVFLLGPTFENTARRLMNFAASQGKGRVMIVSEQNEAGEVAARAIRNAASLSNATVVAAESYAFSQQGVVQAIPRISSAARSSGAQALLLTAGSEGALPLLADLLPQNGLTPQTFQYMGLTRWDIPPATLQLTGLQEGWFALPDPGLTAQFQGRYEAAHGTSAHSIAALGYDGIAAVGALLQRGGDAPFSAASITQASGFAGVSGVFRFRANGMNERGLAVAAIRNQQRVILSPAPRSFAGSGS